ncbi:MAG: nucleoside diphosphate kinase regulator [Halioglobus sp.]
MLPLRNVIVGQTDLDRINSILRTIDLKEHSLLLDELDAATILPDHQLPRDVVCMHSLVTFIDLDTTRSSTVRLVYPHEVGSEAENISILAPIGAALIGLRVGEEIEWPLPNNRRRRLQVVFVEGSPGASLKL